MRSTIPLAGAIFAALTAGAAYSQPARIPPRGVVNAASFARPGLPNGAVAQGSIFSIFGIRIGPDQAVRATQFPLGTELAGVSITITQGERSVQAFPLIVTAGQINAILPSNAPLGKASLRVRNGIRRSNPTPIEIVASSVGIFTATGLGEGPGSVTNFVSQREQPINSLQTSAAPGQVLTIWATGLGPVEFPDNEQPVAGNLDVGVEIWLGGTAVAPDDILYFGRSPEFSGLDQIIVRAPLDTPQGCYVPLHIRTSHIGASQQVLSNAVTIAIGDCRPAPAAPAQQAPNRGGIVLLAAVRSHDDVDRIAPIDFAVDLGLGRFLESPGGPFAYDRLRAIPPPGACTTYGFAGRVDNAGLFLPANARPLDAGEELRVSGPRGVRRFSRLASAAGAYGGVLGGLLPGSMAAGLLNGLFLMPGGYRVAAIEPDAAAAFDTTIEQPQPVDWTNRDSVRAVDRASDLTLEWVPANQPGLVVLIMGGEYDAPTDSTAGFLCTAPASAGAATVPSRILSHLPPSRPEPYQSTGRIRLWTVSGLSGARVRTASLDELSALGAAIWDRSVIFE